MLQVRVMPCLLLKDGKLVKTIKFKKPNYIGDPVNAIKIYNDKEVDELVFLDITATKEGRKPPFAKIAEIADECFMPLAYGGGVRSIEDMRRIFNLGAEKVIICSYAVENPNFVKKAAQTFGSQSVVVAIDIKKNFWGQYEVYTHSGTKAAGMGPIGFSKKMAEMGAGEILLNNIDRDGTWEGYDPELIKRVTKAVNIPVIVSGGAGKIEDFTKAVKAGASAVACGSMVVYQKKGCGVLINFPSPSELEPVRNMKK